MTEQYIVVMFFDAINHLVAFIILVESWISNYFM